MTEFIGTNFTDNIKITYEGDTKNVDRYETMYSRDTKIELSEKIITELDELSTGSKVGIECTKELVEWLVSDDDSDSGQIFSKDDRRHYWKAVIEKCEKKGLDVIFLADNNDYKKLKKESEEWTFFDEYQQGQELGFNVDIEGDDNGTFEARTKEGLKIDLCPGDLEEIHKNRFKYCEFVEIPDHIFQKVKKTNPDLVILSEQTLRYFIMNRPNLVDYSEIEIRGIKIEEIDEKNENRESKNGSTVIHYSGKTKLVKYDLGDYPKKDKFGYRNGDRQTIIERYLATSDIQDRPFED